MFYNRVFEPFRCFILEFSNLTMFYNRVCEQAIRFSSRNRVFYFRVFMHINSRDESPSLNFCFILGYPPYQVSNLFNSNFEFQSHRSLFAFLIEFQRHGLTISQSSSHQTQPSDQLILHSSLRCSISKTEYEMVQLKHTCSMVWEPNGFVFVIVTKF